MSLPVVHSVTFWLTQNGLAETLTVGGLSVPKQEIGLVNAAAWEGDTVNTGSDGPVFPQLDECLQG